MVRNYYVILTIDFTCCKSIKFVALMKLCSNIGMDSVIIWTSPKKPKPTRMSHSKSTCVAQSTKWRTSNLNVTGSHPPAATRHIHYVLLNNSSNKYNLLLWLLLIYLTNNNSNSNSSKIKCTTF